MAWAQRRTFVSDVFVITWSIADSNAMLNDCFERSPRVRVFWSEIVHLSIFLIANNELLIAIVHANALRHICYGGTELLLLLKGDLFTRRMRSNS